MPKRVGRPRARLPKAKHLVTRRIRWLVDHVHEGNLNEASRVTGIAYPTLRDLYVGRTTNPSIQTLETLRKPYTMGVEWFTDPKAPEKELLGGIVGYLPSHPDMPGRRPYKREVVIPYTAWPMYEVFSLLFEWLDKLPPSPERPIVGNADGRDFTERLTVFLLGPYLAIEREKLGDVNTILPGMPLVPQRIPTDEDEEAWVRKMRALGAMWQQAIPDVLAKARAEGGAATHLSR